MNPLYQPIHDIFTHPAPSNTMAWRCLDCGHRFAGSKSHAMVCPRCESGQTIDINAWPLGINPGMDAHAASCGFSHWSCFSSEDNRMWIRRDGRIHECFRGNKRGDYQDELRAIDCRIPMGAEPVLPGSLRSASRRTPAGEEHLIRLPGVTLRLRMTESRPRRPFVRGQGAAGAASLWMVHIDNGRFTLTDQQDGPRVFRMQDRSLSGKANGIARIYPTLPHVAEVHIYQEGRRLRPVGFAVVE